MFSIGSVPKAFGTGQVKSRCFKHRSRRLYQTGADYEKAAVITTHGKSAVVLLDVAEYEALIEKSEVLQDIHTAEQQLEEGKGLCHEEAKNRILEMLQKMKTDR